MSDLLATRAELTNRALALGLVLEWSADVRTLDTSVRMWRLPAPRAILFLVDGVVRFHPYPEQLTQEQFLFLAELVSEQKKLADR